MENKISLRQFLVLLVLALMPQLVRLVPGKQAEIAGAGGWLSSLAAVIPVLVIVWLISRVGNGISEDTGLGELLCLCFGKSAGRVLCGVYGVWLLLLGCISLRFCAERFLSTIYPDTGLGLFFLVLLALEWWLCRRKLEVMARAGQIFFFAVILTLTVVIALGIGNIHIYNMWPVWVQDLPGIIKAAVPELGTMGIGVTGLFFFNQVTDRRGGGRLAAQWLVGMCLLLTVLGAVIMGAFGPKVVSSLQLPFFSLAKEIAIEGIIERVEPLVVTTWVFADVILLGVLLRGAQRAFSCVLGEQTETGIGPLLLLLFPGAYLIGGSAFTLEKACDIFLLAGELVLFFLIPLGAIAVGKCRRVI